MTVITEQTLYVPPRATAFRAVCERCISSQLPSRGYVGATIDGALPLDAAEGFATCTRGHAIRVVRALPESNYR
ncbi:MAG: hypothetical protein M3321_02685 [Actinomycetota bacterium]|nr:hypothetical protein [Actinomycetota bacterium]